MKRAFLTTILILLLGSAFLSPHRAWGESSTTQGRRAQASNPPTIEMKLTPDSIAIGDHFTLEVLVTHDLMQVVGFPSFEKGLTHNIEILEELPADTAKIDGRKITLSKRYLLTCFDEGIHNLGLYPLLYLDKNITDTLWSPDSLYLEVSTFEIDTATMEMHDIKAPRETPLKFGEISGYLLWGLLIVVLLGALIWWLFTRKKGLTILGTPKVVVPPHVEAIKALEALHHQKLWQNGRHKQYYTGITDILRHYIERRYKVAAPDMITPDIIEALGKFEIPEGNFDHLENILKVADLVKFAKLIPTPDENEEIYTDAFYFVEATKPQELEEKDDDEQKTTI